MKTQHQLWFDSQYAWRRAARYVHSLAKHVPNLQQANYADAEADKCLVAAIEADS